MNAGTIDAVLTLNATSFDTGLKESLSAVEKFSSSINKLGTSTKGLEALHSVLDGVESALSRLDGVSKQNLNTLSRLSTAINKMANGLKILQSDTVDVDQGINTMNNIFKAFQGTLSSVEFKVKGVSASVKEMATSEQQSSMSIQEATNIITRNSQAMQQNAVAKLRAMGYTGNLSAEEKRLAVSEEQVVGASNQATASIQRQSTAMNQGSASANRMSTATNGLGRAMSSLRMMTTMVGSMIAYNFVHNLAMATTETINAKSEMNGYFQMLGYTKGQVADFNTELDKTVQLFPRLNKYALGETISSIGVEFELSTAEMKKAMPVVSMITSEYLRAGRNVNEASLAVKDILQGEFQRLSRETGVKQENLMEAGWSGDKSDVMGLLEALDKVGKSRNWDTFVTKANSLNDAVLILQNRFSEWSADMVEKVQPTIVHAFNTIMTVAENFATILNGAMDWLSGDGWGQSIAKWGGLATALGLVTTALIHYRTGANLTQIAQMGLTRSITATILGLEGETVAEYGTRTAIVSRLTGIEAETVAETGRLNSILAVISGLEAEEVAEIGKAKTLTASILGLDMATLKEHGFAVALAESTTQMEAQKLASMSLIEKIALIGATTIPAIAVVGAFAVAFGNLAMKTMEATTNMSNFYDIQKNGKQYVDEAKDSVNNLKGRISELKKTQSKYVEGSKEYENVGKAIDDLNGKVELANDNVNYNYEAWQKVNSAQKNYDTRKQELQLDLQQKINQSLVDTGLSQKEANELSNNYLNEAIDGSKQLYQALQSVSLQYSKEKDTVEYLTKYWQDKGLSPEEIKLKIDPVIDSSNAIAQDIEKMKLSTDVIEVASTWGKLQVDQWDHSFKENLPKIEAGDIIGGLTGLGKGLAHFFADLPIFGDFWDWVFKQLDIQGKYGGKGAEGFYQSIHDFFAQNPIANVIMESMKLGWDSGKIMSAIWGGLSTALTSGWSSISDTINNLKGMDIVGMIFDAIFPDPVSASDGSTDHPSFMEDVSNIIGFDIQSWLTNFSSDPLGTLGVELPTFDIGALFGALTSSDDGTSVLTWVNDNVVVPLSTGITTGIANIPIIGTIAQMLGLVPMENDNAYQTGYNLIDNLKRGVEDKIRDIPIIGDIAQMLGLIPEQNDNAHGKGYGIGDNIKRGEAEGHRGIGDNVRDEMNNVITAISGKFGEAYATAQQIGSQILNGIKDALDMHSPSIISRELIANEFGLYIPQAITSASDVAYQSAYQYGQQISAGISSTNFNTIGFDSAVGEYEADAQMVADSSYLMGTTTTTAFNDMTLAVNQSTMNMQGNVVSSYSQMQQSQGQLLNNMKQSNTTAYNEMYQKSNQSLLQMRDSTSNVTHQMINAWDHMKNSIIASANQLKSDSTAHFNQLSSTIGDFYRKIQNPSNWGAGAGSSGTMVRGARHPSSGRAFSKVMTRGATHHGAGGLYNGREEMTIGALKRMICPNGQCDNLFDGYNMNDKVNVEDFIASITGEHGFGWGDWSGRHYDYIRTTSNAWSMASPVINLAGGIPTNTSFKVGDFENGTPNISFSSFVSMAEAIFSTIPYRYYYDSAWKGSWLGALQAGACNCSDGADALMAFAQACNPNWSVSKQWGKWGKDGHFWAVINGKIMDTTAWQGGYGWTSPKVSGYGSPMVRRASHGSGSPDGSNKTVNVTVNINEPVYGVDALDEKIQESVKQGLREEFNDPYTVPI